MFFGFARALIPAQSANPGAPQGSEPATLSESELVSKMGPMIEDDGNPDLAWIPRLHNRTNLDALRVAQWHFAHWGKGAIAVKAAFMEPCGDEVDEDYISDRYDWWRQCEGDRPEAVAVWRLELKRTERAPGLAVADQDQRSCKSERNDS